MVLTKEQKRAYQKDYMARKRLKNKEGLTSGSNKKMTVNKVTGEIIENKVREYQKKNKSLKILTNPKSKEMKITKETIKKIISPDTTFKQWLEIEEITPDKRRTQPFDLDFYKYMADLTYAKSQQ